MEAIVTTTSADGQRFANLELNGRTWRDFADGTEVNRVITLAQFQHDVTPHRRRSVLKCSVCWVILRVTVSQLKMVVTVAAADLQLLLDRRILQTDRILPSARANACRPAHRQRATT